MTVSALDYLFNLLNLENSFGVNHQQLITSSTKFIAPRKEIQVCHLNEHGSMWPM